MRIIDYFIEYGSGEGLPDGIQSGGIGTTLTGPVHFTNHAESHTGFCHGGSMCSVMDDVIGWVAFCVTGQCQAWTGFTVQINTALKAPVPVGSVLQLQGTIVKMERRKVSVEAVLTDPASGTEYASSEGLVVMNRGVLPET